MMVFFLLLTVSAYVLLLKAPFFLKRSLADACLEVVEEDDGAIPAGGAGRASRSLKRAPIVWGGDADDTEFNDSNIEAI